MTCDPYIYIAMDSESKRDYQVFHKNCSAPPENIDGFGADCDEHRHSLQFIEAQQPSDSHYPRGGQQPSDALSPSVSHLHLPEGDEDKHFLVSGEHNQDLLEEVVKSKPCSSCPSIEQNQPQTSETDTSDDSEGSDNGVGAAASCTHRKNGSTSSSSAKYSADIDTSTESKHKPNLSNSVECKIPLKGIHVIL